MAWTLFFGHSHSVLVVTVLYCLIAISNTGSNDQELFFGLITGTQNSSRALSGVVDALSRISGRDDFLSGYDLRHIHIFNVLQLHYI